MHWIVQKEQTLLEVLAIENPDSSRTTVRSWICEGRIFVDGVPCKKPSQTVHPQQKISIEKKKQYLWNGMEVLHQDVHLIVVYKPAGLLSVATDDDAEDHAHSCLKRAFRRRTIYPVHRLDRDVSGILVFAFSKEVQELLKHQFSEHSILREYFAVVEGQLASSKGTWESYLREEENFFVHSVKDPSRGKLAVTHYEVIARTEGTSVLLITLETGRKNQIRVHAAEAGFPLLGDKKYGSKTSFHGRIALQACKLGFYHPVLQRPMTFYRRPDEEFSPFVNRVLFKNQ